MLHTNRHALPSQHRPSRHMFAGPKIDRARIVWLWTIGTLGVASISGCIHRSPDSAVISAAMGGELGCRDTPRVSGIRANVAGDTARVRAHVECSRLVDDGTFGQSCQNILGCYVARPAVSDCDAIFTWVGGWVADDVTCSGQGLFRP